MAPNDPPWPEETDFPDLTDITVVAQNANATVYRALQVSSDRVVALKIDNRILGPEDDRAQFEKEVRAVGQLSDHPGIIDTYIAGFTRAGRPYVITQLCQGSYADLIDEDGALSPDEVKSVGIRIADALAHAHANRVLHRDIKPANILLTFDGDPVLADFGVACLLETRTETPVVRAAMTPAYAPLETFHLRPSGEPGDVYSLAATLYAMLCGRPPRFPANDRDFTVEDVMSLFGEPIPDIPGVSQVMLGMIRAAMTNNPDGRPTAMQFRDMLESVPVAAATGAITIPPRQAPTPRSAPPPAAAPPAPARPASLEPEPERRGTVGDEPEAHTRPIPASAPPPERHWDEEPQQPPRSYPEPSPDVPSPRQPRRDLDLPPAPTPPAPTEPLSVPPQRTESDWSVHDSDWAIEVPRTHPPSPRPRPGPAWGSDASPSHDPRTPYDDGPGPSPGSEGKELELATRRERRIAARGGKDKGGVGSLVLVGGIAVSIVLAVIAGLVLFVTSGESSVSKDTAEQKTKSCVLTKYGVGCVEKPTCFNGDLVDGDDMAAAKKVSCNEKHEWEAYAVGELPEDVDEPTYANVESVGAVIKACFNKSDDPPLENMVGIDASNWNTNVLPPTEKSFEDGNRQFHCVAQRKDGEPTTNSAFVGS